MVHRELDVLKANLPELRNVLGIPGDRPSNHNVCIFCDSDSAMSVQAGAYFRCHSCGMKGDLVDAVAALDRITKAEAIKRLTGTNWTPRRACRAPDLRAPEEPIPPPIDRQRGQRIRERAFLDTILGKADRWLSKRGIVKTWLELYPVLACTDSGLWTIAVVDPVEGHLLALKGHNECPQPGRQKAFWWPIGTENRHGYATLWPPPEWWPDQVLYLTEGELKAAALQCAGYAAISPTTGASFKWTPGQQDRVRDRDLVLVYDDDDAGHIFRDNTLAILGPVVKRIRAITFGQKEGAA